MNYSHPRNRFAAAINTTVVSLSTVRDSCGKSCHIIELPRFGVEKINIQLKQTMKVTNFDHTLEIKWSLTTIRKLRRLRARAAFFEIGSLLNNYIIPIEENTQHSPSVDWFCGERTSISRATETPLLKTNAVSCSETEIIHLSVFFLQHALKPVTTAWGLKHVQYL